MNFLPCLATNILYLTNFIYLAYKIIISWVLNAVKNQLMIILLKCGYVNKIFFIENGNESSVSIFFKHIILSLIYMHLIINTLKNFWLIMGQRKNSLVVFLWKRRTTSVFFGHYIISNGLYQAMRSNIG